MATDLDAVINNAIDSAVDEGSLVDDSTDVEDTGVDTGEESTEVAEETTDDTTTTEEKPKVEDVDALMEEFIKEGYKPRKGAPDNKIPYSNVQKIIGNREKRAVEAVVKALGLDEDGAKAVSFDKLESVISEKFGGYRDLEEKQENYTRAEEIMMNDPDRYIRILATIEPEKYGKFLDVLGTAKGKKKGAEEEVDEEDFDITLPDPDVDLGDGQSTYSKQGLQAAIKDAVKQGIAHGKKIAQTTAEGVVKPIADERKRANEDAEAAKRTKGELETALKWKGMEEHFDTVLDALKKDTLQATRRDGKVDKSKLKYKNIRDAYIDIVPALLSDADAIKEQKVRKKILEEQGKTVKSTSVGSSATGGKKKPSGSGDPVTDAINRSLERAGL